MSRHLIRMGLAALAMAIVGSPRPSAAQEDPNLVGVPAGMQVLNSGPIHEAFAEPVIFDPRPGPVIPKQPPPPIQELPPDQRPMGSNVQWIPGYWCWDDGRNDFVWVSGIWRDVPPGRHWVPGYWSQAEGGFQWVPGFWASANQDQVQYLPPPPESLEAGPSGPAPGPDSIWMPGTWTWQDTQYVWRPGFWAPSQPDWLWVPAHYVWTPSGDVFVDGYWDRPLQGRGVAFAPVYFQQPLYNQPNFTYTPVVGLLSSALLSSLFVRPAYHQYYFGDYNAPNSFQSGIFPWYSFHQSRYGYDPLFSYYAATNGRRDPQWVEHVRDEYRFRRENEDARRNLVLTRPINQFASLPRETVRFEPLERERREQLARQATQLHEFREQRRAREIEAARFQQTAPAQPRRLDLPRSPIAFTPARGPGAVIPPHAHVWTPPPPALAHPEPDFGVRAHAEPFRRPEPHPDRVPGYMVPGHPDAERFGHPLGAPRPGERAREQERERPRLERRREREERR